MKKCIWVVGMLVVLSWIVSCGRNTAVRQQLECLDSLSDVRPDSALTQLESMRQEMSEQSEHVRMYYELLCVKAADKAFIVHTDDSLILQIVQYYDRHQDDRLTPLAWYYAGRVHADMGDAPQAWDDFQKALDACEGKKPEDVQHTRCVAYAQMGELYTMQLMSDKALQYHRLAYEANAQLGDTVGMIYNLRDFAQDFYYQLQIDSALYYYDKVKHLAYQYGDTLMISLVKAREAEIYAYLNDSEKAIELLVSAMPHIPDRRRGGGYSTLSEAYHKAGQLDSAVYYYGKAMEEGNIYAKVAAAKGMAEIALSLKNAKEANAWLNRFLVLSDSLTEYMQAESVERLNHVYDYHIRERENSKLQHESDTLRVQLILFIALFFCVIALTYAMYRNHHARRQRQQMQYVQLKRLKEYQLERKQRIVEEKQREIKALESQLSETTKTRSEYLEQLHQKNDELSELHLQLAQLQSHDSLIKERVKNTDVVRMIQNKGRKGKTLTMNEWEMVEQVLHQVSPDFIPSLMALYPLNDVEKQVCMLLKLEIPLSCIAAMVCRDKSAVSKIRQRLYKKAFGTDAPPSAWDEVIASL